MNETLTNFLIGGISATISRTCTAPIELYRLQRQNYFMPNSTIRAVIKKEGIRYLWKGNFVNCIRAFPQFAIAYPIQNYLKKYKFKKIEEKKRTFISSGISGSISILAVYPLETIRSRLALQTNKNHYTGLFNAFKNTRFLELYGGSKLSIFGFGLYNAIIFTIYPIYQDFFENNILKDSYYGKKLLCGGFSGLTAITITYPTDLIRRRLQLQGFDSAVPKYSGVIDCAKKIYRTESLVGFYRGVFGNYYKTFPMLSIQFFVIDSMNDFFKSVKNT